MAAALTMLVMQPHTPGDASEAITLALHEARAIDVLIQSDRDLPAATIRIAVTGGVALDGFANDHIIDWRADLERGSNLVSLPVVARKAGDGHGQDDGPVPPFQRLFHLSTPLWLYGRDVR